MRAAPDQIVPHQHALHGQRGGAGDRMADVRVPVLEESGSSGNRVDHATADQHGADRLIAPAQPFRDRHKIGRNALLLAGMQRPGAAHAAHHFVEDQQNAVRVAQFAHTPEVAGRRASGSRWWRRRRSRPRTR